MSDTTDRIAGLLGEHPPTETEHGPLYCKPCSEKVGEWVPWTPAHVAAVLAEVVAEVEERAHIKGYEQGLMDPGSEWMNARNERAEKAEAALADLRDCVKGWQAEGLGMVPGLEQTNWPSMWEDVCTLLGEEEA